MVVDLCTCLVQRVHCGAAQLKLAAGLQRHALPVLRQTDDVPLLDDGLPVEALPDARQQRRNLLIRQPPPVRHVVPQLLVLGAYPALAAGWGARGAGVQGAGR